MPLTNDNLEATILCQLEEARLDNLGIALEFRVDSHLFFQVQNTGNGSVAFRGSEQAHDVVYCDHAGG